MHVLGFDFGLKHIGVAIGQSITQTATPLCSISATDGIPNWAEIDNLIQQWHPTAIVVGIPLNMDGTEQLLTHCARQFAKRLHNRSHLPVHHVDERLSTWEAKDRLKIKKDALTRIKNKKTIEQINALSAAILVEQWMSDST